MTLLCDVTGSHILLQMIMKLARDSIWDIVELGLIDSIHAVLVICCYHYSHFTRYTVLVTLEQYDYNDAYDSLYYSYDSYGLHLLQKQIVLDKIL